LGVIGDQKVRVGGDLGVDSGAWGSIARDLPVAHQGPDASVAVDWALGPGESAVVRFVLAWYSPQWVGSGAPTAGGNTYTHMYAARYASALEVARFLAQNHEPLLGRILAWQEAIYTDSTLPGWLQDSLINVLHLITETSVWAQAKPPVGAWCRAEDGIFGVSESPRICPQIECIPCSFFGNLPLVYFFPELALSTLRTYKAYQYPSGQAPWNFSGISDQTTPYEMVLPSQGYPGKPQTTLDGPCYVDMVDRLWRRTGDNGILREFYESVKKNTIFTMNLRPGSGAAGIVSMPAGNAGQDWFETCDFFGIMPHIGGAHLAQLGMAQRMAEAVGDRDFARQCAEWLEQGSAVLEEHAWAGSHYVLYNELETGKRSDIVMGYQLDGEWMALFHGLEGVFRPDRVATTLETIRRANVAVSDFGAVVFCNPGGKLVAEGRFSLAISDPEKKEAVPLGTKLKEGEFDPGYWGPRGVHPPGTYMLAMAYIYHGQREFGLDLARRMTREIIKRGWAWDWPIVIDGAMGGRQGADYGQDLMLWSLPAALEGGDLASPCKQGKLVERVIRAGKG
jgi:uncharacterized protein (DUF608 family)